MGISKFPNIHCDMNQNVSKFDKNNVFNYIKTLAFTLVYVIYILWASNAIPT